MGISNIIDSKLNEKEIISVFCNPEDNYSTVVGFVSATDEDYFVLKHVTVAGRYDGYVLRRKDQIFRIDQKTSYENSLFSLYKHYDESHADYESKDSVLLGFLEFAKSKGFVIGIGARDYESSSVLGYIEKIDIENETVSIHLINDEGKFDGYSTISFNSIVKMSADCEKDLTLKTLNSITNK